MLEFRICSASSTGTDVSEASRLPVASAEFTVVTSNAETDDDLMHSGSET